MRRPGEAACQGHKEPRSGDGRGDAWAHGLAVLQAISFFATDIDDLYEGVYYCPMIFICFTTLITCTVTTCLLLGLTGLITTFCFLLVLLLLVRPDAPQNPQGSWGCF